MFGCLRCCTRATVLGCVRHDRKKFSTGQEDNGVTNGRRDAVIANKQGAEKVKKERFTNKWGRF